MPSYTQNAQPPDFSLIARSFGYREGAPFTGLIGPKFFQHLADEHDAHFGEGQGDTYNAPVTTWAWLSQAFSPRKSCFAAACRVLVLCAALGRPLPSANAGALCKARPKLPAPFLEGACLELGEAVERRAPPDWRWRGRPVKVADGSIVQVQDTPENLAKYPQQRSQKPGCGPTSMRVVVLLGLATAALVGCATGAYRGKGTGEMSLLWSLLDRLEAGDVLLGDRYYGCYLLLACLPLRGVDGCFRLPVQKQGGFDKGQRLGRDDHLHTWDKTRRPKWISSEEWDKLPAQVQVRVLRLRRAARPGWRAKEVYVVTTLTDPVAYPAEAISALYLARWNAELDIRSIKQTLGMKALTSRTPEMVERELWAHLLAYNLTRCVMAQAAWERGLCPRQLSFAAAVQALDAFRLLLSCLGQDAGVLWVALSAALGHRQVGNRPGRYEPRELKKRQRKYPELKKSRQQRRQELVEAWAEGGGGGGDKEAGKKGRKGGGKDRPSGRGR